jgi:hypothetical protein
MSTAPTPEQLRAAVETAQSVTAGISDPELRGIAFGKVLDRLLAGAAAELPTRDGSKPRSRPTSLKTVVLPSRDGPRAWVESLLSEGYFSKSKSLAEVTEAVRAQGHNVESKNVTDPLEKLVQAKALRRERKASEGSKRGIWMYSNY